MTQVPPIWYWSRFMSVLIIIFVICSHHLKILVRWIGINLNNKKKIIPDQQLTINCDRWVSKLKSMYPMKRERFYRILMEVTGPHSLHSAFHISWINKCISKMFTATVNGNEMIWLRWFYLAETLSCCKIAMYKREADTWFTAREQITNRLSYLVAGMFAGMCPFWWTRAVTSHKSQVTSHKLKLKAVCFLWLGLISKGNSRRTCNIYKLS